MKRALIAVTCLALLLAGPSVALAQAEAAASIKLSEPAKKGGLPMMEALWARASVRAWSEKELSAQDLSDLLWAANGINRPDKRRTAASAMNAQDVDIYVFMRAGVHLYDAANHALTLVVSGDHRSMFGMPPGGRGPGGPGGPPPAGVTPPAGATPPPGARAAGPPAGPGTPAPLQLMLVSDAARFGAGTPELKYEWGALDTGIVSQNIALFCAARGLATRPRAGFDKDKLKALLKLKDSQHPFLNHPVGYPVETPK